MKSGEFYNYINDLLIEAMDFEIDLPLKPGAVSYNDCGPHFDMDYNLFKKSIAAIDGYFIEICQLCDSDIKIEDILKKIRPIGINYEEKMFEATGGINTHKGSIFLLGLLAASCAKLYYINKALNIDNILNMLKDISKDIMKDFESTGEEKTFGEKIFLEEGFSGIRGEVHNGLITVKNVLEKISFIYPDWDRCFLHIMSVLDDTTTIKRAGISGLEYAKKKASDVLKDDNFHKSLELMCRDFKKKNISSGGSCDMLQATYFLWCIEHDYIYHIQDSLKNKEFKQDFIENLVREYKKPIVTLNLNIHGMFKDKEIYMPLYRHAKEEFEKIFLSNIIYKNEHNNRYSYCCFYIIDRLDTNDIKKKLVELEDKEDVMRLIDFDLIDEYLNRISRNNLSMEPRKCLLCDDVSFLCIRESRHDDEAINEKVRMLLKDLTK